MRSDGSIFVHPKRRADADQWMYVLAHCLLHLGFGHCREREQPWAWNLACDVVVDRFLRPLKFAPPSRRLPGAGRTPGAGEEALYATFRERGVGPYPMADLRLDGSSGWSRIDWANVFAQGLASAVEHAVEVARRQRSPLDPAVTRLTVAQQARRWFINSYPLLGALAAAFTIVEDPRRCQQIGISVAAVDIAAGEILV